MKNLKLIPVILIALTICGCASLKGSISSDVATETAKHVKATADSAVNSLSRTNENLRTQLATEKKINEARNVKTRIVEEDALLHQKGGTSTESTHGTNAILISKETSLGRIRATGTYFYKQDSLEVKLVVGDTTIMVHRKIVSSDDKSQTRSETNTSSTTNKSIHDFTNSTMEVKRSTDTKAEKKVEVKTKLSLSASIGISNWWPVIIALLLGLSVGIALGRKSKK